MNHRAPINRTYWDAVAGKWVVHMKWGTISFWPPSDDVHTILIRYLQLCLNRDLELMFPCGLMATGIPDPAVPEADRANPWHYVFKYLADLQVMGELDTNALEELNSLNALMQSRDDARDKLQAW
eukprot:7623972-Heterocapsa_arctica.AAC.1